MGTGVTAVESGHQLNNLIVVSKCEFFQKEEFIKNMFVFGYLESPKHSFLDCIQIKLDKIKEKSSKKSSDTDY